MAKGEVLAQQGDAPSHSSSCGNLQKSINIVQQSSAHNSTKPWVGCVMGE
jgi:hypothetical protein